MTHLLQQAPSSTTHLIIKKAIQRGDRVIFQHVHSGGDPLDEGAIIETEVTVTDVQTEPGLMKGWCCISWLPVPNQKPVM